MRIWLLLALIAAPANAFTDLSGTTVTKLTPGAMQIALLPPPTNVRVELVR